MRFIWVFLITALIVSCSKSESSSQSKYLAESTGPINLVSVFAAPQTYKAIEESLSDTLVFGKVFPGLYYPPEIMFANRHFEPNLEDDFRQTRLVLNIKQGEPKITFTQDKYSKPQAYVEVWGQTPEQVLTLLQQNQDSLLDFYRNTDRRFVLSYNKSKAHQDQKALNDLGVKMVVPRDYALVESNDSFVWYRKDDFNTITNRDARDNGIITHQSHDIINLMFYKIPFRKDSLTLDELIQIRDSIGKTYTKGSKEPVVKFVGKDSIRTVVTDHEQTEQNPMLRDMYSIKKIGENADQTVYESQGYWSMTLTQMGGPYTTKAIIDKKNHMLYVADAFIFAPLNQGKSKKRDYLTLLESLFTTFQIKNTN